MTCKLGKVSVAKNVCSQMVESVSISAASYVYLWFACVLCSGAVVTQFHAQVNSLTTQGYLLEGFINLWIPSMVRIFTSVWTGNLSQGFIDTFSVGSPPWTHPLISECSIVRAFRPENSPPD